MPLQSARLKDKVIKNKRIKCYSFSSLFTIAVNFSLVLIGQTFYHKDTSINLIFNLKVQTKAD